MEMKDQIWYRTAKAIPWLVIIFSLCLFALLLGFGLAYTVNNFINAVRWALPDISKILEVML